MLQLFLPAVKCTWGRNVKQADVYTSKPNLDTMKSGIFIKMLKRYISICVDQTSTEWINARGYILNSEVHKHINFVWNKEVCQDRIRYLLLFLFMNNDKTEKSNYPQITLL